MAASDSSFSSVDSQNRWVREMRINFRADNISYTELNAPYCVYRVPQGIAETKPEAYAPQRIGLGPYHHQRRQLYKMHKQKLAVVREALAPQDLHYIDKVVDCVCSLGPMVRACYDQYLDFEPDTLAWIVTIDGLFLLRYLKSVLEIMGEDDHRPEIENLLGDIFMLENQIPSVFLKKIGLVYRGFLIGDDDSYEVHKAYIEFLLNGGFLALCQKHSPLKLSSKWEIVRDTNQAHLLHRMYHLIVNKRKGDEEMLLCNAVGLHKDSALDSLTTDDVDPPCSAEEIHQNADNVDSMLDRAVPAFQEAHLSVTVVDGQPIMRDDSLAHLLNHMYRCVDIIIANNVKTVTTISVSYDDDDAHKANFVQISEKIQISESSVWANVKQLPRLLNELGMPGAGTADRFLSIISQVPWDKVSALQGPKVAPPPVEQIEIPTISDMSKILGITFEETPGGIRDAHFDEKKRKLYLPVISLGTHSETILRNLLAYEAASATPESLLELAEYIDMMCGMIDTKTDVEILRDANIIDGELPDDEIVVIFNGIRKTTGESEGEEKSNIGKAISAINKMYGNIWSVKAKRKLVEFASSGMKYANVIVTMVVVLLLMTQAFCTVFGCARWFGKNTANLQLFSDQ